MQSLAVKRRCEQGREKWRDEVHVTMSGSFGRGAALAVCGAASLTEFRLRAASNFFHRAPKVAILRLPGLIRTVLCSTHCTGDHPCTWKL